MHTHISVHADNLNLLNINQGGFREKCSTISITGKFIDNILLGKNDKHYTVTTFIDLKKAFDTVHHQIIIRKYHILESILDHGYKTIWKIGSNNAL